MSNKQSFLLQPGFNKVTLPFLDPSQADQYKDNLPPVFIAPGVNVTKVFASSLSLRTNKLTCLALPSPMSKVVAYPFDAELLG